MDASKLSSTLVALEVVGGLIERIKTDALVGSLQEEADFDADAHKRGPDGKFVAGAGGGSSSKKKDKEDDKEEPKEEEPKTPLHVAKAAHKDAYDAAIGKGLPHEDAIGHAKKAYQKAYNAHYLKLKAKAKQAPTPEVPKATEPVKEPVEQPKAVAPPEPEKPPVEAPKQQEVPLKPIHVAKAAHAQAYQDAVGKGLSHDDATAHAKKAYQKAYNAHYFKTKQASAKTPEDKVADQLVAQVKPDKLVTPEKASAQVPAAKVVADQPETKPTVEPVVNKLTAEPEPVVQKPQPKTPKEHGNEAYKKAYQDAIDSGEDSFGTAKAKAVKAYQKAYNKAYQVQKALNAVAPSAPKIAQVAPPGLPSHEKEPEQVASKLTGEPVAPEEPVSTKQVEPEPEPEALAAKLTGEPEDQQSKSTDVDHYKGAYHDVYKKAKASGLSSGEALKQALAAHKADVASGKVVDTSDLQPVSTAATAAKEPEPNPDAGAEDISSDPHHLAGLKAQAAHAEKYPNDTDLQKHAAYLKGKQASQDAELEPKDVADQLTGETPKAATPAEPEDEVYPDLDSPAVHEGLKKFKAKLPDATKKAKAEFEAWGKTASPDEKTIKNVLAKKAQIWKKHLDPLKGEFFDKYGYGKKGEGTPHLDAVSDIVKKFKEQHGVSANTTAEKLLNTPAPEPKAEPLPKDWDDFDKQAKAGAAKATAGQLVNLPPKKDYSDPSKWKKQAGSQLGSNPGGVYTYNGEKHYVKFPKNAGQARTEAGADAVHELLGVKTNKHQTAEVDGKVASVSAWQPLTTLEKSDWKSFNPKQKQQAADIYMAAVLTNNWDVVGDDFHNVAKDQAGNLVVGDTGGSFNFRAQGSPKEFKADPSAELGALLDPSFKSGQVFGPLHKENPELFKQAAAKLKNISQDDLLAAIKHSGYMKDNPTAAVNVLEARRKAILKKFGVADDAHTNTISGNKSSDVYKTAFDQAKAAGHPNPASAALSAEHDHLAAQKKADDLVKPTAPVGATSAFSSALDDTDMKPYKDIYQKAVDSGMAPSDALKKAFKAHELDKSATSIKAPDVNPASGYHTPEEDYEISKKMGGTPEQAAAYAKSMADYWETPTGKLHKAQIDAEKKPHYLTPVPGDPPVTDDPGKTPEDIANGLIKPGEISTVAPEPKKKVSKEQKAALQKQWQDTYKNTDWTDPGAAHLAKQTMADIEAKIKGEKTQAEKAAEAEAIKKAAAEKAAAEKAEQLKNAQPQVDAAMQDVKHLKAELEKAKTFQSPTGSTSVKSKHDTYVKNLEQALSDAEEHAKTLKNSFPGTTLMSPGALAPHVPTPQHEYNSSVHDLAPLKAEIDNLKNKMSTKGDPTGKYQKHLDTLEPQYKAGQQKAEQLKAAHPEIKEPEDLWNKTPAPPKPVSYGSSSSYTPSPSSSYQYPPAGPQDPWGSKHQHSKKVYHHSPTGEHDFPAKVSTSGAAASCAKKDTAPPQPIDLHAMAVPNSVNPKTGKEWSDAERTDHYQSSKASDVAAHLAKYIPAGNVKATFTAINDYSNGGYKSFNKAVQSFFKTGKKMPSHYEEQAAHILEFLHKCPPFTRKPMIFRASQIPSSDFEKMVQDFEEKGTATYCNGQVMGAGTSRSVAHGFMGEDGPNSEGIPHHAVMLHILGHKTARGIRPMSQHETEDEVLFSPKAEFTVKSISRVKNGYKNYHVIELMEVGATYSQEAIDNGYDKVSLAPPTHTIKHKPKESISRLISALLG